MYSSWLMSKYSKAFLSYEEQADLLISRGLEADRGHLIQRLEAVSYYRLSGYLYPYRKKVNDPTTGEVKTLEHFVSGTTLDLIWERYCFDRRLRVLILDAIERIEVALRSRLIYYFTQEHGPFGYQDEVNLPKISKIKDYLDFRLSLQAETARSKEQFKQSFFRNYSDTRELPLWMVAELMSMGNVLTLLKGVSPDIKRKLAADFHLPDEILMSWFTALYAARNICAHHSRIWNRTLGHAAIIPRKNKYPEWSHSGDRFVNNRSATILFICRHWLQMISPTSKWHERVEDLIDSQVNSPLSGMSLPLDWKTNPIWAQKFY